MKIGDRVRVNKDYSDYGSEWFVGRTGVVRVIQASAVPHDTNLNIGVEFQGSNSGHNLFGRLAPEAHSGWWFRKSSLTVVRKRQVAKRKARLKKARRAR